MRITVLLLIQFRVSLFPVKRLVYVMTGSAGQGLEIYIHFFKLLMLFNILTVATAAPGYLKVCVMHRFGFDMHRVAGCAVDGLAVVGAAVPFDR